MKQEVKCKDCKRCFEIETESIKHDKWIVFPLCGGMGKNGFYEGEEEKTRSYVG